MRRTPYSHSVTLMREQDKQTGAVRWSRKGEENRWFVEVYVVISSDGILPYRQQSVEWQVENLISPIFQRYATNAVLKQEQNSLSREHKRHANVNLAAEIADKISELHLLEKQKPTGSLKGDNLTVLVCPLTKLRGTFMMGVADGHGNCGQSVAYQAVQECSAYLGLPRHAEQLTSLRGHIEKMQSQRPVLPTPISTTITTTTTTTTTTSSSQEVATKTSPRTSHVVSSQKFQKVQASMGAYLGDFFKKSKQVKKKICTDRPVSIERETDREKTRKISDDSSARTPNPSTPFIALPLKGGVLNRQLDNARNIHALGGDLSIVVNHQNDVETITQAFYQKLQEDYPNELFRKVPDIKLRFGSDTVRVILLESCASSFGGNIPDLTIKAVIQTIQASYNQNQVDKNSAQEKKPAIDETEENMDRLSMSSHY